MVWKKGLLVWGVVLLWPLVLWGHGGEVHSTDPGSEAPQAAPMPMAAETHLLNQLGQSYRQQAEPILTAKCAVCHHSQPDLEALPWYYSIPGVKQLMDYDMETAQTHLNLAAGFPFESHAPPADDLKALIHSLKEETMPPLRYRIVHWNSTLSPEEMMQVVAWAEEALAALTALEPQESNN